MDLVEILVLLAFVFFPLIQGLGFDPVWFGNLNVCVSEISLITPPLGMNVFVLRSVLPDVPLATMFRGILWFWVADILRIALIVAFPMISLWALS